MKLDAPVRYGVGRRNAGSAGIIVVKFPGGERAVTGDATLDFNHAGRAEISPGEFLFARPNHFDGMPGSARQSRGLKCGVGGVLAAVGRPSVGAMTRTWSFERWNAS